MFKSARWRSEKNKIKAVFRLQFHATQVSQLVGDALMISVIPADIGKPSVKLEKSTVRDGSCYWENPVYETVKLIQDPKTGKIHERIYHFVVSTGTSKAGLVGEVSIDFANYTEATKISSVSLPLKNAKSEAVLHVSIQRMMDSVDQREIQENEHAKLNSQDKSSRAHFPNGDTDGGIRTDDGPINTIISHVVELNGNRRASSCSDVTVSSSESISGFDTPRELGMKDNNSQQKPQWEWLGDSAPEESTDDSSSSPRETLLREQSQEASDITIEKLKSELAVLARHVEVSELELQTLRKQVVKESKRGQDLLRELVNLKKERDAFKEECEKLEVKAKNKLRHEEGDPMNLVEELRQELNYDKELNVNLRLQLVKTQESNSQLVLAVRDLDEMLEQKNKEILNVSNKSVMLEESSAINFECETDDDEEEQKALEELVNDHSEAKEAYLLKQKIMDLYNEIEVHRKEKDELEMQMEQLALDYEILNQENHDISYKLEQSELQEQLKMQYECSYSYASVNELEAQIDSLENELKKRSEEFSDSLVTISELEAHVQTLEEELDEKTQGFEANMEDLIRAKVEQEQRAIKAEETLRKTRWKNANKAERLQEEFRKLFMQMVSTFDENEKLAAKAMTEGDELRLEKIHLEEMLQKVKEEFESSKDLYEAKLHELSSQITLLNDQVAQMELLEEKGYMERNELEIIVSLVKKEAEDSVRELNMMSCLKDEKESIIRDIQSDVETHRAKCNELKHSLFENELEKEKMRKQVSQLIGDLKKKEDALNSIEKELKDSNDNKSVLVPRGSEDVANLKEKIKYFEDQIKMKENASETSTNSFFGKEEDLQNKIEELERRLEVLDQNNMSFRENDDILPELTVSTRDQGDHEELSKESVLLKERNKSMEHELKEMQERYSEISLKFAEVEGERQELVMTLRNHKNAKRSS